MFKFSRLLVLNGFLLIFLLFGLLNSSNSTKAQVIPEPTIEPSVSPEPSGSPETSPSPSLEPSSSPSASPSPSESPKFSCCERDIKVNQVSVVPQKTTQGAGTVQVHIDFKLDVHFWCDFVRNQDCLAFYDVVLEDSQWEKLVGGKWVPAAATESIIPDPPLKVACDGKGHKGTWSYSYIATVTAAGPIRNNSLIFDWDIPANKGRSYHSEYQVFGISSTTGTKPPTVKGSHPKQK